MSTSRDCFIYLADQLPDGFTTTDIDSWVELTGWSRGTLRTQLVYLQRGGLIYCATPELFGNGTRRTYKRTEKPYEFEDDFDFEYDLNNPPVSVLEKFKRMKWVGA
jgi:hypothetical protein